MGRRSTSHNGRAEIRSIEIDDRAVVLDLDVPDDRLADIAYNHYGLGDVILWSEAPGLQS